MKRGQEKHPLQSKSQKEKNVSDGFKLEQAASVLFEPNEHVQMISISGGCFFYKKKQHCHKVIISEEKHIMLTFFGNANHLSADMLSISVLSEE